MTPIAIINKLRWRLHMQKCKENIHRVRIIDNMKHIYRCHITNEVCNLQGHNSIKNSTYFSFNLYQEDLNQKVDKEKKPKKKRRRDFNRYGETGKPHKIHTYTLTIRWSRRDSNHVEGAISLERSSRVFSPSRTATTWDIVGLREGDWSVHIIAKFRTIFAWSQL